MSHSSAVLGSRAVVVAVYQIRGGMHRDKRMSCESENEREQVSSAESILSPGRAAARKLIVSSFALSKKHTQQPRGGCGGPDLARVRTNSRSVTVSSSCDTDQTTGLSSSVVRVLRVS